MSPKITHVTLYLGSRAGLARSDRRHLGKNEMNEVRVFQKEDLGCFGQVSVGRRRLSLGRFSCLKLLTAPLSIYFDGSATYQHNRVPLVCVVHPLSKSCFPYVVSELRTFQMCPSKALQYVGSMRLGAVSISSELVKAPSMKRGMISGHSSRTVSSQAEDILIDILIFSLS